ncbi:MAG: amidophosphoribosyltransferase, partial [Gammaproteobacteria bacterium]
QAIGADWLVFQDLEDLIEAVRRGNPEISEFDCSVFTGQYVTGGVTVNYLEYLEGLRSDTAKEKRRASGDEVIEMHNNA